MSLSSPLIMAAIFERYDVGYPAMLIFGAVMVLALYIQDEHTISLYRHPEFIWLSCPLLLFWVSRTWMLTHRGEMHDDPVVFAIKDKVSLVVGVLFGVIFWMAR